MCRRLLAGYWARSLAALSIFRLLILKYIRRKYSFDGVDKYNRLMKLRVYIKIGRRQGVLGWNGEELSVGVDASPVKGAANEKLIDIFSDWLAVRKNQIKIVSGATSRHKILEIDISLQTFNELVKNAPKFPAQSQLL